jgi:hypothetical protein
MTTDNSTTQISEPSNVAKRTVQKTSVREIFRRAGEHSDGGQSQELTGDDNQLSGKLRDAKAMITNLWKTVELHEQHYNKIQRVSTN